MAKKDTIQVDRAQMDKQGNIEITVKSSNEDVKNKRLIKHVAENISGDAKIVVFKATRREMLLFIHESYYIQFRNHTFATNVPETINIIKTHGAFGRDIFETEYPEQVKKKMEEYRSKFTRDPEEHESGEL